MSASSSIKTCLKNAKSALAAQPAEPQDALRWCKEALKKDKKNYMAFCIMGKAGLQIDQPDAAEKAFRKAIEINAEPSTAYLGLTEVLSHTMKWDALVQVYTHLLEHCDVSGRESDLIKRKADAFFRAGAVSEGVDTLKSLIAAGGGSDVDGQEDPSAVWMLIVDHLERLESHYEDTTASVDGNYQEKGTETPSHSHPPLTEDVLAPQFVEALQQGLSQAHALTPALVNDLYQKLLARQWRLAMSDDASFNETRVRALVETCRLPPVSLDSTAPPLVALAKLADLDGVCPLSQTLQTVEALISAAPSVDSARLARSLHHLAQEDWGQLMTLAPSLHPHTATIGPCNLPQCLAAVKDQIPSSSTSSKPSASSSTSAARLPHGQESTAGADTVNSTDVVLSSILREDDALLLWLAAGVVLLMDIASRVHRLVKPAADETLASDCERALRLFRRAVVVAQGRIARGFPCHRLLVALQLCEAQLLQAMGPVHAEQAFDLYSTVLDATRRGAIAALQGRAWAAIVLGRTDVCRRDLLDVVSRCDAPADGGDASTPAPGDSVDDDDLSWPLVTLLLPNPARAAAVQAARPKVLAWALAQLAWVDVSSMSSPSATDIGGGLTQAQAWLTRALTLDPKHPEHHLYLALCYWKHGLASEACTDRSHAYASLLRAARLQWSGDDPCGAIPFHILGKWYSTVGDDLESAIRCHRRALALSHLDTSGIALPAKDALQESIVHALGLLLLQEQRMADFADILHDVTAKSPAASWAYPLLGRTRLVLGQHDLAIRACHSALALRVEPSPAVTNTVGFEDGPDHSDWQVQRASCMAVLGQAYRAMGKFGASQRAYADGVEELGPVPVEADSTTAASLRSHCHAEVVESMLLQGMSGEAFSAAQDTLALYRAQDALEPVPHVVLASLSKSAHVHASYLATLGRDREAADALKTAHDAQTEVVHTVSTLFMQWERLGDICVALSQNGHAAQPVIESLQQAEQAFRRALHLQPSEPSLWLRLGSVLVSQSLYRDDGGKRDPPQAPTASLAPPSPAKPSSEDDGLHELMDKFGALEEDTDATADGQQPNEPDIETVSSPVQCMARAIVLLESEPHQLRRINMAGESAPDVVTATKAVAWSALGYTLAAAGRYAHAQHAYLSGLQQDPKSMSCLLNLASLYFAQKQWTHAFRMWQHAHRADPTSPVPWIGVGCLYALVARQETGDGDGDEPAAMQLAFDAFAHAWDLDHDQPTAQAGLADMFLRSTVGSGSTSSPVLPTESNKVPDSVLNALLRFTSRHPASAWAQNTLGIVRELGLPTQHQGTLRAILSAYDTARGLAQQPQHKLDSTINLAHGQCLAGQAAEALQTFQSCLRTQQELVSVGSAVDPLAQIGLLVGMGSAAGQDGPLPLMSQCFTKAAEMLANLFAVASQQQQSPAPASVSPGLVALRHAEVLGLHAECLSDAGQNDQAKQYAAQSIQVATKANQMLSAANGTAAAPARSQPKDPDHASTVKLTRLIVKQAWYRLCMLGVRMDDANLTTSSMRHMAMSLPAGEHRRDPDMLHVVHEFSCRALKGGIAQGSGDCHQHWLAARNALLRVIHHDPTRYAPWLRLASFLMQAGMEWRGEGPNGQAPGSGRWMTVALNVVLRLFANPLDVWGHPQNIRARRLAEQLQIIPAADEMARGLCFRAIALLTLASETTASSSEHNRSALQAAGAWDDEVTPGPTLGRRGGGNARPGAASHDHARLRKACVSAARYSVQYALHLCPESSVAWELLSQCRKEADLGPGTG